MDIQVQFIRYNPVTGESVKPLPVYFVKAEDDAEKARIADESWVQLNAAGIWLHNPLTGELRYGIDIVQDPHGRKIIEQGQMSLIPESVGDNLRDIAKGLQTLLDYVRSVKGQGSGRAKQTLAENLDRWIKEITEEAGNGARNPA